MTLFYPRQQRNHYRRLLGLTLTLIGLTNWFAATDFSSAGPVAAQTAKVARSSTPAERRFPVSPRPTPDRSTLARAKAAYGQLPLSFEANRGQTAPQVEFLVRGHGYNLFLTSAGAIISLRDSERVSRNNVAFASSFKTGITPAKLCDSQPAVLRLNLVGADSKSRLTGSAQLPGKSNYFIGRDPKKWRTKIPNYGKVTSRNVYRGIDVIYYGNQQQLEYDFRLAPGADPKAITLEFAGADSIDLDAAGNLVLQVGDGQIIQRKPFVYQEVNGVSRPIAAKYVMRGNHQVGFEVGVYDVKKPLIIDPVFVFSTYLGGSNNDQGTSIAVDPAGRAYATGITSSPDFPLTAGVLPSDNGGSDVSGSFSSRLKEVADRK